MNINELYAQAVELHKAKNYDAVFKILNEIKSVAPDYGNAYFLEAWTWEKLGNFVKEYYALKKMFSLLNFSTPEKRNFAADILARTSDVCREIGFLTECIDCALLAKKLSNINQRKYSILDALLYGMNHSEIYSADEFKKIYDEYNKYLSDIMPYPRKFYEHEKIRVGFISADFYNHAVMRWSWVLLNGLDKSLFEVYFYSNVEKPDNFTEHFSSSFDGWRDIRDLTDEEAAKLIRDDEIDILFDLSGHTKDNRLRVAAYHPASVQMSGIGYINSTGLDCFDYFLSDIYCAGDENFFTEKLIKLAHSHFCYEPMTELEPADAPPCLKNKFITFGSFNQFKKITDSMLNTWKKILDAVPNSRLILKAKIFRTEDGKIFASERLKSFDFDLARVEMRPFSANYLAEYADVDIALDTFPYTGGVTTCEALYMGVPVVSLYGDRHGTRFGLSILKNVGLDALVVNSYDEYIKLAVSLANDWKLLALLRKNLRTKMRLSPLMDFQNYLREIQDVFIQILNEQKNSWRDTENGR